MFIQHTEKLGKLLIWSVKSDIENQQQFEDLSYWAHSFSSCDIFHFCQLTSALKIVVKSWLSMACY